VSLESIKLEDRYLIGDNELFKLISLEDWEREASVCSNAASETMVDRTWGVSVLMSRWSTFSVLFLFFLGGPAIMECFLTVVDVKKCQM
jgi:hypothetical protein